MKDPIANVDLASYSPGQRATMEQALTVMADVLDWDRPEITRITGRDWTTLARFYQGKPQGDTDAVIADLARLAAVAATSTIVRTPIVTDYIRVLDNCRRDGSMGVIVAATGRGKTSTLRDWRRHNQRATIVQCPSQCSRGDLVFLLADALRISGADAMTQPARERALFQKTEPRDMLLIDEAGYLVTANRRTSPLRLLQDLHDHCRCPIVMTMRPSAWDSLVSGRTVRDDEQLLGRILHRSIVAAAYKRDEIIPILALYRREKPTERLLRYIRSSLGPQKGGLRALCHDLAEAADLARTGVDFDEAFIGAVSMRDRAAHLDALTDF